jgi:hypothetical protein
MQRQLRLGDILDDYCPRERRVTNHVIVAMVNDDIKQTRCATCDTEHEYKHAKVPRQRKKSDTPGSLYAQVLAGGPKRVAPEHAPGEGAADALDAHERHDADDTPLDDPMTDTPVAAASDDEHGADAVQPDADDEAEGEDEAGRDDEGPVHRPLIRASLPKHDGQLPPSRPIPEFTIRQPAGRQNRFRPRGGGGGGPFMGGGGGGNRSNGNLPGGPRGMRSSGGGGRQPPGAGGNMPSRQGRRRHGPHGPKRSK